MLDVYRIMIIVSILFIICSIILFLIQPIHKRKSRWINICLIVSLLIFIIINMVNIITYKTEKDSHTTINLNNNATTYISPKNNAYKNDITEKPSEEPTKFLSEQKIDYQWYKAGKTYIREDGEKSITFSWHDEDYVRFIFNDGFVMTETKLYVDNQVENGLLYEVIKAGTVKLIYYYNEDKIEVIDSELNYNAHTGIYYPSNDTCITLDNKINYQWYQSGKKYIGGENGDVILEVNHFSDGYFQFAFNGSYVLGTSFLSDTMKSHTLYYNVSDEIQLFYYYNEDKIEVVNTEYNDDYICGYYYPENTAGNNSTTPKERDNNQINYYWYYDRTVFVREDGAHTFSMGWLDNKIYQFEFDGGYVVGTTDAVDSTTIPNVLLYQDKQDAGGIEVLYHYNEDKIQVIDSTDNEVNFSGYYDAVKSLKPSEHNDSEILKQNPKLSENNVIDYEWYFTDKRYVREDEAYVFEMRYMDSGYLYFIFNDNETPAVTHYVDDTTIPNALVYEGDSGSGKMYVIYFYNEDKVQVIDDLGDTSNYNGYYYINK